MRRLRRAGVHNVERHLVEAGDKWAKRRAGSFDRVLVDAPCTGIGTWRRNPDARLRLRPEDLAELVRQAGDDPGAGGAAGARRAGGWSMRPARCSTEENEAQVDAFLAAQSRLRAGAAGPGLGAAGAAARRRPVPAADAAAARHRRVLRRGAGAACVIAIRRARPDDAAAIGAVHVAAWRSAYPGILPEAYLARLSARRQAARYEAAIRAWAGRACRHRLRRDPRRRRAGRAWSGS